MTHEITAAIGRAAIQPPPTPPDIQTIAIVVREMDRPWLNLSAVVSLLHPDGRSSSRSLDVVLAVEEAPEVIHQLERGAKILRELVAQHSGIVL